MELEKDLETGMDKVEGADTEAVVDKKGKGKGKGKGKVIEGAVTFVADADGNQYTTYGEIGVQFRGGRYTTEDEKEIAYLSTRRELTKEGE